MLSDLINAVKPHIFEDPTRDGIVISLIIHHGHPIIKTISATRFLSNQSIYNNPSTLPDLFEAAIYQCRYQLAAELIKLGVQ